MSTTLSRPNEHLPALLGLVNSNGTFAPLVSAFQLDFRYEKGFNIFFQWVQECQDETNEENSIIVLRYTWFYSSSDYCGKCISLSDATTFTLAPTGHIEARRSMRRLDEDACNCNMNGSLYIQDLKWNSTNTQWTVTDFVRALRQERELLIESAVKMIDIFRRQNKQLQECGLRPC